MCARSETEQASEGGNINGGDSMGMDGGMQKPTVSARRHGRTSGAQRACGGGRQRQAAAGAGSVYARAARGKATQGGGSSAERKWRTPVSDVVEETLRGRQGKVS